MNSSSEPPSPVDPPQADPPEVDPTPPTQPSRRVQFNGPATYLLIGGLLAFSILYRLTVVGRLEQSSVLFIGVPAAFALLLTRTAAPQSTLGFVFKATTLALLMSMIVLGEGMVCVLMASPIIFAVILVVWALVKFIAHFVSQTVAKCSLIVPLALVSLEGTTDALSFSRHETVVVSRVVAASPSLIVAHLASPPRLDSALPTFLQAGFPRPQWIESGGIDVGDQWRIRFAGGEGQPGVLVLEVVERDDEHVRFVARQDTTKIAHWLAWREAVVTFTAEPRGGTRVTWSLAYDRELDPAWYFAPLERYAVGLAADFLVDNLAVPR